MSQPRQTESFKFYQYLTPNYWLTWIGLGMLRLMIYLPYPWLMQMGNLLGRIGYYLMPSRRRIIRVNLQACFPEFTQQKLSQVARDSFCSASCAIFESAISWWASDNKLQGLHQIVGLEHCEKAFEKGNGILLVGAHYTTIDISGRLLSLHLDNIYPTYKQAHNKLFDAIMTAARTRSMKGLIASSNMRGLIRTLKNNNLIWYAPDQDFGLHSSVFAPFMGIQATTLTTTSRIAKASKTSLLPFSSERLPDNKGYLIRVGAALEKFPSGDDVVDATRINQTIEEQVRRTPEQYLWGHRRFKTRPRGEAQFYPARRDKPLRTYSRLLGLVSLPAIVYTAYMALRTHKLKYLKQRLGFGHFPGGGIDIWFHAASVGEVNAVIPLLSLIHKVHPDKKLILTVNTPSGYDIAESKLPKGIECHFLPIDWMFAVKRFIRQLKPKSILIVETEIWPNLYLFAHYLGIPIIIINGRLSEKSTQARPLIRWILTRSLEAVYAIYARSDQDASRFIEMKFKPEYIKTLGNLKYARQHKEKSSVFQCSRPYVLAASTRPGEERLITEAWLKLKLQQELLIIVPRHPKRLATIIKDLSKFNIVIAVRSREEQITDQTRVYIADTFGELEQFIAGSLFVVMGGSFNQYGGQNILEVAQAGKAVLFGQSMENFQDECQLFIETEAGVQIKSHARLFDVMEQFLNNHQMRDRFAQNALTLTNNMEGITERYLTELECDLPILNSSHRSDNH